MKLIAELNRDSLHYEQGVQTRSQALCNYMKGSSIALPDLIGGQVSMMFSSVSMLLPPVKAGRLRGLAMTSAKRSLAAPELPTVAESGLPRFEHFSQAGSQNGHACQIIQPTCALESCAAGLCFSADDVALPVDCHEGA